MASDLTAALGVIADAAGCLEDEWWVFGSAAMALVGVVGLDPPDVDLLTSERDAGRLMTRWQAEPARDRMRTGPPDTQRFRSTVFARTGRTSPPIEIMAGLEVRTADGWAPVRPRTRLGIDVGRGRTIFVPSAAEQMRICRMFGRPKDIARLPALAALIARRPPDRPPPGDRHDERHLRGMDDR